MSTLTIESSKLPRPGFAARLFFRIVNWFKQEYRLTYYAHVRWKAENGDAAAQCTLATMCEAGNGVFQTQTEAAKWYQKAAFQGVARAQLALGLKYLDGLGVGKNDTEALLWLRKAAEQGQAEAQYQLGLLYRDGRGTPRDLLQASKWLRKAADRGHMTAQESFKELNPVLHSSVPAEPASPLDQAAA